MMIPMTEMQKSALLEAGNIGSGHAAIALSQLMGRKIMIAVPLVEVYEGKDMQKIFSHPQQMLSLVSVKVLGDTTGIMLFSLDQEKAFSLCEIVMGQAHGSLKAFGELETSALKEVASIVTASYLNALSEMTGLSLIVSVPEYYACKGVEVKEFLAKKDIKMNALKDFLCIKTEFIEADTRIEGYLLFVPEEQSVQKILAALGV